MFRAWSWLLNLRVAHPAYATQPFGSAVQRTRGATNGLDMLQLVLQIFQVIPMLSVLLVGYVINWVLAVAVLTVPTIWWTVWVRRRFRMARPRILPAAGPAEPHAVEPHRPRARWTVSRAGSGQRPDDDTTLERLHEDVVTLARASLRRDPVRLMPDIERTARRAMILLDEGRYPQRVDELHLLTSMSLCVASDNDLNLGNRDSAAARVRLARAYAENIQHWPLQAWCCSVQSWILAIEGLPQRAAQLAVAGQEYATTAVARRRLHGMHGNALALIGDRRGALRAFDLAREELPDAAEPADLIDEVGGVFSAPLAKQCQNAAYGLTRLGLYTKAAAAAEKAIYLYAHGPDDQRDYVLEAGARVNLAISYVMRRQLDAASDTLRPILGLPLSQRVDYIRMLMVDLQQILVRHRFKRSIEAANLRAEIEEFTLDGLDGRHQ
jgi:tetratricopeptide (TPR) repeat protein